MLEEELAVLEEEAAVFEEVEASAAVSEEERRVKKRGRAAFMVQVAQGHFVAVWDNDDELLVQWTVS